MIKLVCERLISCIGIPLLGYVDYYSSHELDDHLWEEGEHEREEMHVWVDSHIVANPVIADIDRDGVSSALVRAMPAGRQLLTGELF